MVFTNALEYDPFQIPKNQWSTHSVTDTDGGGFNFLHHAKLGGRLSKGKLGYPCHILPYAAIIHHPYIGRWMAGGICWYIISLTLPRLPNFSNFETSFFLLHDLFSKLKPPKNWKHEMNIFGILFYRLENNMKSWKSSFSKLIFPSTNLPRKKKKKTAKQLVALTKKMGSFPMFFQGNEGSWHFFLGPLKVEVPHWQVDDAEWGYHGPMWGFKSCWDEDIWFLGGGNSNIFYFHPYLGKISNLTNIFQRGWNHQLDSLVWHFDISGHHGCWW